MYNGALKSSNLAGLSTASEREKEGENR